MANVPNSRFVTLLLIALLILFSTLAVLQSPTRYHAYMVIGVPESLNITVLIKGRTRASDCETSIAKMSGAILGSCPGCQLKQTQCLNELDPKQQRLLFSDPPNTASLRGPGNMAYDVTHDHGNAVANCEEGAVLAGKAPLNCYYSSALSSISEHSTSSGLVQAAWGTLALVIAGLASWFVSWLIIRYEHLHSHLSHDPVDSRPQAFHTAPTPRVGGLALLAGLFAGGGVLLALQAEFNTTQFGYLLLAGTPAFLGGIVEDVTKNVVARQRLLLTVLAGSLGAWLMGAILNRLDVFGFDAALLWLPFAVALTVVAIGGVANAINIIDGYNGLAAGFAVIALSAMAWVAMQVGDGLVFTTALILIGSLLGFLAWNWPQGRIFLGDGGAYLLGFILAELSVLLVVRNPVVSPWFPMALLVYPIFETLFSIYRRVIVRGHSPGRPDGVHLHQLICKRIIRQRVDSTTPGFKMACNSRVAPFILRAALAHSALALVFFQSTTMLAIIISIESMLYVYLYRCIATWYTPRWLLVNEGQLKQYIAARIGA